ncbi:MAG TPA: 16S rRNA (cytidine(1402)-2'-O)-methyltransferase [bacterium]|nr:16S rRNA (cytidine(1402)-2'-O)-methyltransferase [bacterium]
MAGTLYVVSTPIGNLEDLTFRALRVLKEVEIIACEDTRHTRTLLAHYGIDKRLLSYHEHNERQRTAELLQRLEENASVALLTDAGTPALSDPGYAIVHAAAARGIPVIAVPGASAVTAALAVAGLPTDRFAFLGFLPRKSGERKRALVALASIPWTLVFFEAPHRLRDMLKDVADTLGDREVAVGRELTKRFEEVIRGSLGEVQEHFRDTEPRGEFTVVVAGAGENVETAAVSAETDLKELLEGGMPPKNAVQIVARRHGVSRRAVYQMMLEMTGKRQ